MILMVVMIKIDIATQINQLIILNGFRCTWQPTVPTLHSQARGEKHLIQLRGIHEKFKVVNVLCSEDSKKIRIQKSSFMCAFRLANKEGGRSLG